jgi:hypothetical protein
MQNFDSPDLVDIAYLSALRGYRPTPAGRRGNLFFFTVPLDAKEAEQLLASPEREFIQRVFVAWRQLRRAIDFANDERARR